MDTIARTNLGLGLGLQGKTEEAIRELRMAIRLDPDNVRAYTGLGLLLQKQGNIAEAIEIYQRVLGIRPDFQEARTALEAAVAAGREPRKMQ